MNKNLNLRKLVLGALAFGMLAAAPFVHIVKAADVSNSTDLYKDGKLISPGVQNEELKLTNEWDKIFPQDPAVKHHKVTFHNRYGITLAADVYEPAHYEGKLPGLAVAGPYGAVKEQASGLYAQQMAKRGYVTIAFDPSFTGESGGNARNVSSPDINTEDFSAAVDFLSTQDNVDPNRIGLIGICGFGGFALNDAAMDTRVKATVASTMYDISRFYANGYFDKQDSEEARTAMKNQLNQQRTKDYEQGYYDRNFVNQTPDQFTEDTPQFVKDYHDFYHTKRGYHPRAVNSRGGWNMTNKLSFINMPILDRSSEIETPVLMIHGEKAHSRYFAEDAFKKLKGNNKELYIVPNAVHTDLYDQVNIIPFDKIDNFFKTNLR